MIEFLVEVTPGEELLYRTPLELRAAIRCGEITADSRIFHRATSSWVSITKHPEYRKVQASLDPPPWLAPIPAPESVEPLPVPHRLGFLRRVHKTVAALVTGGWASIRKHLATGTRPTTPPKAAATENPASSIQAGELGDQAGAKGSSPNRNRWTFYP